MVSEDYDSDASVVVEFEKIIKKVQHRHQFELRMNKYLFLYFMLFIIMIVVVLGGGGG